MICIKSDTIDDVVVSLVSLEGVRGKFTFRKLPTVIGPEAVVVIGSCLISTENKKVLVPAVVSKEHCHSELWILRPLCCRPTYQEFMSLFHDFHMQDCLQIQLEK